MTSQNDMRAAFERDIEETDSYDFSRDADGDYIKPDTWEAYQGFKAGWQARTSLDVEKLRRVREAYAELQNNLGLASLVRNPAAIKIRERSEEALTELDQLIGEREGEQALRSEYRDNDAKP